MAHCYPAINNLRTDTIIAHLLALCTVSIDMISSQTLALCPHTLGRSCTRFIFFRFLFEYLLVVAKEVYYSEHPLSSFTTISVSLINLHACLWIVGEKRSKQEETQTDAGRKCAHSTQKALRIQTRNRTT